MAIAQAVSLDPGMDARITRRAFLTDGGEATMLSTSPTDQLERFETFADATGVPVEQIVSVPVVRFPIPVSVRSEDGTIPRWSGVNPEVMWHPYFWLPERVAFRYNYQVIDDAAGGTVDDAEIESDETWAIRVMLEMAAAGLYDVASGTWLDVLAYHGLDIENPVDMARLQAWQDGDPDEVLDSIDLSPMFEIEGQEEDWALVMARQLGDLLVPAQWALSAATLLGDIAEQLTFRGDTDDVRRDIILTYGRVCAHDLRTVPDDPDAGVSIRDLIEAIVTQCEEGAKDSAYLMDTLQMVLKQTANDYDPYLVGVTDEADGYEGAERFV